MYKSNALNMLQSAFTNHAFPPHSMLLPSRERTSQSRTELTSEPRLENLSPQSLGQRAIDIPQDRESVVGEKHELGSPVLPFSLVVLLEQRFRVDTVIAGQRVGATGARETGRGEDVRAVGDVEVGAEEQVGVGGDVGV